MKVNQVLERNLSEPLIVHLLFIISRLLEVPSLALLIIDNTRSRMQNPPKMCLLLIYFIHFLFIFIIILFHLFLFLYFYCSSGSGTGSTQPREYNWGATS
jgi:hypothetical protein